MVAERYRLAPDSDAELALLQAASRRHSRVAQVKTAPWVAAGNRKGDSVKEKSERVSERA